MFDQIRDKFRQFQFNIYDNVIRLSYQRARLEKKKVAIDFGEIAMLTRSGAGVSAPTEPVMLLLHGFGSEKDTWLRFVELLHLPLPLVIPDLPGHGESTWDSEQDYSIHSQAYRVHQMLVNLGITAVHIVGHSMGGAIALRLAHLYPEMVRSLVLISAAGAEIKPGRVGNVIDSRDLNPLVDVQNKADFQRLLDVCMHKHPYLPRIAFNVLAEKKIARFEMDKRIFSDMVTDLDQSAYLAQLQLPVLIIWGDKDLVLDVADAQFLHERINGSEKIILNGIGHVPMLEEPQHTCRSVRDFFQRYKIG
ncbi:alpha/beta fold hydrolase [Undibacterium sp. MH2W]|uniref:alpha/beta fold hydrolase n=1 Tax=Undibacterium sp. MH2W TaxID=3413044 RepID=UPI003BF16C7C